MADTGFQFPGTTDGARLSFGIVWINPDNVKADDGSQTTNSLDTTLFAGDFLGTSNYDFSSVPSGATIDGIEVKVGDHRSLSGLWGSNVARLILADDTFGSEDKNDEMEAWTNTIVTSLLGGASDLWSETISRADVQDIDWGFEIHGFGASDLGNVGEIDFIQQKVYYTLAGGNDLVLVGLPAARGVARGASRGVL